MTLSVSLYRHDTERLEFVSVPDLDSGCAAGFECYRTRLWGSRSLTDRGAAFMPALKANDLYVTPDEFDAFRDELAMIHRNARMIAHEIWPYELIDRYCPVQRSQRIRRLRVRGARDIRTYVNRFRSALDVAERMNLGFNIS
ncbi:hypothetical protein [Planctomycetes bacterium TBK1r]|uniref:hypothetical protein n=1 Tax=Stieleria magnilauensis TaxID=2527963 RepID=UPI0011A5E18E